MPALDQYVVARALLNRLLPSGKNGPHHRKPPRTFIATLSPLRNSINIPIVTSELLTENLKLTAARLLANVEVKRSRLAELPTELLLRIISFVEPEDMLALVQTCDGLKRFIKIHAAVINNTFLQTLFPEMLKIVDATLLDGWLRPQHDTIHFVSLSDCDPFKFADFSQDADLSHVDEKESNAPLDSLAPKKSISQTKKATLRGPQLLCYLLNHKDFFQQSSLRYRCIRWHDMTLDQRVEDNLLARCVRLWRNYTFQHSDGRMEIREHNVKVSGGYKKYNKAQLVKHLGESKPCVDLKRPRCLMWYFGISGTENRRDDEERGENVKIEAMVEVLRLGIEKLSLRG